jgi:hypothetical protein
MCSPAPEPLPPKDTVDDLGREERGRCRLQPSQTPPREQKSINMQLTTDAEVEILQLEEELHRHESQS